MRGGIGETDLAPRRAEEALLAGRLGFVLRGRSYKRLGEETGYCPGTARRMVLTGRPSARFIARVCVVYEISPEWLLLGRGPVRVADARRWQASLSRVRGDRGEGGATVEPKPWGSPRWSAPPLGPAVDVDAGSGNGAG